MYTVIQLSPQLKNNSHNYIKCRTTTSQIKVKMRIYQKRQFLNYVIIYSLCKSSFRSQKKKGHYFEKKMKEESINCSCNLSFDESLFHSFEFLAAFSGKINKIQGTIYSAFQHKSYIPKSKTCFYAHVTKVSMETQYIFLHNAPLYPANNALCFKSIQFQSR